MTPRRDAEPPSGRDAGYAAAAAMLAAAAFALVAAQVARTSRSEVQGAYADAASARLDAAADAGFALALQALTSPDPRTRWDLGDAPHELSFAGARLSVVVEDERGKIPINTLTPTQVASLFRAAGAPAPRAAELTEAFLDWRDPQRAARRTKPTGPPRPGGFLSVFELRDLAGMDEALFARLEPEVTVSNGDTGFDPAHAGLLALQVMEGADSGSVRGIEARRERSGQRTALSTAASEDPHSRAVTVAVTAQDDEGGRSRRRYLVELTGAPARPYLVRQRLPA